MLTCPITGDFNFDHLVEVVSAKFLHCKVIILFVIDKYLMGRYFATMQITVSYVFILSFQYPSVILACNNY